MFAFLKSYSSDYENKHELEEYLDNTVSMRLPSHLSKDHHKNTPTPYTSSALCVRALIRSLCLTFCNLYSLADYSLSGSSAHGIFQARILEWVAIPSSGGSSQPRDQTWVSQVPCTGRRVLYH